MPIIQSLDRALNILDLFDEKTTELRITDISNAMHLHKSTIHSLLKTLQMHGYIDQEAETGKYRLGLKLLERGNLLLDSMDIRKVARKTLLNISEKTGQTAHLVVLDGKEGVYIDKVEGAKAAIRYSRIGRRIPLHTSATGKALLAFRPDKEVNEILKGYKFHFQTPNTITDREKFINELEQVRQQGYSIDNQENEIGVRCIGVPVKNYMNQVIAAISISTIVSTVGDEELSRLSELLKEASYELSQHFGYQLAVTKG